MLIVTPVLFLLLPCVQTFFTADILTRIADKVLLIILVMELIDPSVPVSQIHTTYTHSKQVFCM